MRTTWFRGSESKSNRFTINEAFAMLSQGVGIQFGPDVTARFLERNGLDYVIRSHEVKADGYEVCHDGKCITVFSAPNYCDTMGNQGAFITLNGSDMKPQFTTYQAVVSFFS